MAESLVTEIESIPDFTKNSQNSTLSEGCCPQNPTFNTMLFIGFNRLLYHSPIT